MLESESFQEKDISEIMVKINEKHDLIQRYLVYDLKNV